MLFVLLSWQHYPSCFISLTAVTFWSNQQWSSWAGGFKTERYFIWLDMLKYRKHGVEISFHLRVQTCSLKSAWIQFATIFICSLFSHLNFKHKPWCANIQSPSLTKVSQLDWQCYRISCVEVKICLHFHSRNSLKSEMSIIMMLLCLCIIAICCAGFMMPVIE